MSNLHNDVSHVDTVKFESETRVQLKRVLLVEDNPGDARLVREMLGAENAKVELETASSLSTAIELLRAMAIDVVLLDLSLPDSTGLDTLRKVLAEAPGTAIVVLTGLDDETVGDQSVKLGAQSFLVKGGFEGQLLLRTLRHANERQRLITQLVGEISLRSELQQVLERTNRDLEKRISLRTEELRKVNRALSMLSRCNRTMLHAKHEQQLLYDICKLIVGPGAYPLAWIGSVGGDGQAKMKLDAYAGEDADYLQALDDWNGDMDSHGPVRSALDSGQYVVQRKADFNEQAGPWLQLMQHFSFTGVIVLPLNVHDQITGVLVIYSRKVAAFDDKEVELLLEMAADLSFGVTALRTGIERERERTELIKFSSALKQADDIIIITDKEGFIDYVNPAFERVTGFSLEEARGQSPGSLVMGDSETRGNYAEMWQVLMRGEPYRGTFINRRKDGGLFYEQKTITPIKDKDGKISHYLSTGKDITDDLELQERLRRLLNYDVLTGLPNRNLFLDRLNQLHEQAQWEQRQFAVAIINIDRFKNINSSLGHHMGDEVLRSIAQRMKEYFHPMNVVARLVGNTFAVILSDQDDIERIIEYARKLLSFLATPGYVLEKEIAVSACVGVAIAERDSNDATELLRNAEAAMYQAKQRGPNQIEFYNKSINAHSENALALEVALRHALERQEFILYYQPKIDLASGKTVGVEALIRWQPPDRGLVSPAEFIPLLEQTGLIVPVGQWVLEESCRQLRAWDDAGMPPLQMGLNLSPRQFLHDGLIEDFSAFFDKHGLESVAGRLEIEITESSFMHDLEHGIVTLQKLKDLGLRIAIDDFGTGYSSLSYLSRLPVDVLKIDRSFISNIPERGDDAEVVRAIVALAKSLNLHVVAEGVENKEQQEFLQQYGCDLAQGFYYSAPQSAEKLSQFLQASVVIH